MRAALILFWYLCISAARADSTPACKTLLDPKAAKLKDSEETAQSLIDCATQAQLGDGRYQDAKRAFDMARDMASRIGNRSLLAHALEGSGDTRQMLGDMAKAEPMLRESLRIREELGDNAGMASSLAALGRFYITAGDDDKIREYSERSLKLQQQLGNHLGVAIALNNLGISWKAHDVLVFLDYAQRSLAELTALGDERRANTVRNNIALANYQLGDLQQAIATSREVLATWERIGFGDKAGVAETSLGIEYLELGNYRIALQFLGKALAVRIRLKYTFAVAESWNNLALVYRAQGAYEQAEAALHKSIELTRKLANADLESESLANLGEVQMLAGKPALAAQSLLESLHIAEKLDGKLKIAFAAYNLGRLELSRGRLEQSAAYLKRSLAVEEQIHDRLEEGQTLVSLSDLERTRGNLESSRNFAMRALRFADQTGQTEVQWTAFTALGRVEKALGHPDEARKALDSAIDALEDLRTRVAGGAREQAVFFSSRTEPYQERMTLALQDGHAGEAFHYSERARARALLDTIDRRHDPLSKSMTTEERAEEKRLRVALTAVNLQMQSAQLDTEVLRKRQDQARLAYQAFETALYSAHPQLRVGRAESPIVSAKEAQALLPGPNTALLEFAVTPAHTRLFVISAAGVRCFTTDISQDTLRRRVERFRSELAHRDLRVDEAAGQLYALLLAPARAAFEGASELIIAPDGPLWGLPFQALEPKRGHFLIEDCSISYVPSFTVLRAEMQAAARRRPAADSLLAFGNPAGRTALPDALRQVEAVAALYQPSSRTYTGTDASEERWKKEAPPYRILHFATHAVFDDRSPLYSHIALAEPQPGSTEDGLLEAWEIMQLDLNAQLSVLSACETARGAAVPGEGLVGLTWALFVAGSPSALVSQWKVDAAPSGELMLLFHRTWRGGDAGITKTRAMRQAQLAMLRKPDSHPFDWAGFILVGDGQ